MSDGTRDVLLITIFLLFVFALFFTTDCINAFGENQRLKYDWLQTEKRMVSCYLETHDSECREEE